MDESVDTNVVPTFVETVRLLGGYRHGEIFPLFHPHQAAIVLSREGGSPEVYLRNRDWDDDGRTLYSIRGEADHPLTRDAQLFERALS